ncbi:hypothetical protein DERF_014366 [Dermatophagoides farinae]|uniref:Uncharacterized protein n=1 Tax=Dermatophagoides farinae TaxID=6954 RepID=A0A922HM36_DERFA|nr:hypothetical protein DERF_014366 [Dermatophagoides farinae]
MNKFEYIKQQQRQELQAACDDDVIITPSLFLSSQKRSQAKKINVSHLYIQMMMMFILICECKILLLSPPTITPTSQENFSSSVLQDEETLCSSRFSLNNDGGKKHGSKFGTLNEQNS